MQNTPNNIRGMTKIESVCLATIILIVIGISYVTISNREAMYDAISGERIAKYIIDRSDVPENMEYLASCNMSNNVLYHYKKNEKLGIAYNNGMVQFYNTALYAKLIDLPDNDYKHNVVEILRETGHFFTGFREALLDYITLSPQKKILSKPTIIQYIKTLNRDIFYSRNK